MRGQIAVIGWGSLIWDPEILAPHIAPDWRMGDGPALPLEFSRISPKRKMGLAVCIDADWGAPCATHVALSLRGDAAAARADLAARERAPLELIGIVCARTGLAEGAGVEAVSAWVEATGAAGAVWTGLRPNFAEHAGRPFDHDAAEAWLLGLGGESRDEAVRYMENAPKTADTPLRRRLAARDWWREEAARVRALDAGGAA